MLIICIDLPAMQQKAEEIARIFGFDPDEMQSEPEDLPVTDSAEKIHFQLSSK